MQVFIVGSAYETAKALDTRRLNRQISEAKTILAALKGAKAWNHHPCVLQYKGHERWLNNYLSCLMRYQAGKIAGAKVSSLWCKLCTPPFHTEEFLENMKKRLYTKAPHMYSQWSYLGKSNENWYWSPTEKQFIKYCNGKRV
jgi:hypothetical protein